MRRRQRRFEGCVLAIALLLFIPRTGYAAPAVRLVYVRGPGAEQCPGEQAIRASVSARLGHDPFLYAASDTLTVEIQRHAGTFRTRVRLLDAQRTERGAREISFAGKDCSDAVELMGLTISLTIDPSVLLGTEPLAAPAAKPPTIPALSGRPTSRAEPATTAAAPRHPVSLYAGLRALGSVRVAPATSFGGALFIGAAWRMLSLDIEGRADYPASGPSDVGPTEVRSRLLAVALAPCVHMGVAFGCPIVAAGILEASARNVARSQDGHGPWSAAGARLGAEVTIAPRLRIRAHAELLAVLTHDPFLVDGIRVYTTRPWAADLAIDALWLFR